MADSPMTANAPERANPNELQAGDFQDTMPSNEMSGLSLSSRAIHGDDFLNQGQDVAPAMHVSTTFRYPDDPDKLEPTPEGTLAESHIYSRESAPSTTRFEAILASMFNGPVVSYASGLSAFHAMLVFLNPKAIAISGGYHGCHSVIDIHQKLTGLKKLDLDCPPEDLQPGDVVHVETPLNPYGSARNLRLYAEKAHARGAILTVDATLGPPPLQDPLKWGADIVLHSGTKYVGGHSDMLCGILCINPSRVKDGWFEKLKFERTFLGNVMGSMEAWLGIRSLRTMEVRVERQSSNAGKLVSWLDSALKDNKTDSSSSASCAEDNQLIRQVVEKVEHASLQEQDLAEGWLKEQMPNGFGPVFAIWMKSRDLARKLPSKLNLFHHATSLGGVESLIEWRTMSDMTVDARLLRVSVGIENWEDLRNDLLRAFRALADEEGKK